MQRCQTSRTIRSRLKKQRWYGKAAALVELSGDLADAIAFRNAVSGAYAVYLGDVNRQEISTILYRAFARAELNAPIAVAGSFIAAGSPFDAMIKVGRVLATALQDLFIVDPYADEKVLSDFAIQSVENVQIRLLADDKKHKPGLKPAADRWIKQHGSQRPLEVRLAPSGQLHDRLIFIDRTSVWNLGQSFNALATRAHTSLLRVDEPETKTMKLDAYEAAWNNASPMS